MGYPEYGSPSDAPRGRGATGGQTSSIFGLSPARVIALAVAAFRPTGDHNRRRFTEEIKSEAEEWVQWLRRGG